jgi:hypothetical protein
MGETKDKPDMIFFSKVIGFVAVEIKDGDEARKIYDGSKILEYHRQYKEGKVKYYINDSVIPISLFIMATQNSVNGKLFTFDDLTRKNEKIWGGHPETEYQRTADYIRHIWGSWRKTRRKNEAGIGILLSGVLDGKQTMPMVFCHLYDNRWIPTWTIL